jgi:ubiquinone/menaquinone biosynthesis C-methylase UbiE
MTQMTNFTQPDVSPTYFIDFLELLDNLDEIKRVRAEFIKRMNLAIGDKVLDLGCGIGG